MLHFIKGNDNTLSLMIHISTQSLYAFLFKNTFNHTLLSEPLRKHHVLATLVIYYHQPFVFFPLFFFFFELQNFYESNLNESLNNPSLF